MPQLTVQGSDPVEVSSDKRLVQALVEDAGTDQLHACGGNAKCTTCRVKFIEGEPQRMTAAEKELLKVREISEPGVRLSCQVLCENDMKVELISRLEGSGREDQGGTVADEIQPQPVEWVTR